MPLTAVEEAKATQKIVVTIFWRTAARGLFSESEVLRKIAGRDFQSMDAASDKRGRTKLQQKGRK